MVVVKKKIWSHAGGGNKNVWTPCRESGGMLSHKILKISFLRLAENVFPTFSTHQFVVKMLRSSSNRLRKLVLFDNKVI